MAHSNEQVFVSPGMAATGLSRRGFLQSGAAMVLAGQAAAHGTAGIMPKLTPWEQKHDRKIRIGVVGGGFGIAWHWHEHPNCVVEAVSDLLPARRERLVGRYGCQKTYDSLEELVKDPNIDAVALFTPAPDHARHTILCMEHGKHVICACPTCMTVEEAALLKEVKERTGLWYMSAETSAYRWETQFARDLVSRGVLGEVVYCEGEYYHPHIGLADHDLSVVDGKRTWRYGFPPALYPTHSTAFLVRVTGERLTKVSCIGTGDKNEPALKDNQYGNPFQNAMMQFETNKGNPFRCNVAWNIHADGERAQWFGTQGSLYMAGYSGQPFVMKRGSTTVTEMPDYFPLLPEKMRNDSGHGASHPFISHEFIMALLEEREPAIDLYEGLAYCVPGIVAHESALQGGARLDIPQFDRV